MINWLDFKSIKRRKPFSTLSPLTRVLPHRHRHSWTGLARDLDHHRHLQSGGYSRRHYSVNLTQTGGGKPAKVTAAG